MIVPPPQVGSTDFRDQLIAILVDIDALQAEIGERLADEARIAELGESFNLEYRRLEQVPPEQAQDEFSRLKERTRPFQEEINGRYEQFAPTKGRITGLVQRLRDALNRVPTTPVELRDLRNEIERLDLVAGRGQFLGWRSSEADLTTIRGRLKEMLLLLTDDSAPGTSETSPTQPASDQPAATTAAGDGGADVLSPEEQEGHAKRIKRIRQARIEMWNQLAKELTTIQQANRGYTDLPGLKRKYPRFKLWSILSEAEQGELLSIEFRPRTYAGNLVLRQYGLTSLETLKKDRLRLRKADQSL